MKIDIPTLIKSLDWKGMFPGQRLWLQVEQPFPNQVLVPRRSGGADYYHINRRTKR